MAQSPAIFVVVVVIETVIEKTMKFGHEQLDVYQVSLKYVAWAYRLAKRLHGMDRHARDQLVRASQSILLNIAEGNGKGTAPDRRRFFEIARGSALECAAIQDTLEVCEILEDGESEDGKAMLIRIVSMLTKLGRRDGCVRESPGEYGGYDDDYNYDYDNDNDNDKGKGKGNGNGNGRDGDNDSR